MHENLIPTQFDKLQGSKDAKTEDIKSIAEQLMDEVYAARDYRDSLGAQLISEQLVAKDYSYNALDSEAYFEAQRRLFIARAAIDSYQQSK